MLNFQFISGFGAFHTNEPDPEKPDKFLTPYGQINWAEICGMVDNPPSKPKEQAQWLIPSSHASRNFKTQEKQGVYRLLWADFDKNPPNLADLHGIVEQVLNGADYELYNTRSATLENQKARLLIPLEHPLPFHEWCLAQEVLNDKFESFGIIPDRSNERAAQLCYLPNRGDIYNFYAKRNGEAING